MKFDTSKLTVALTSFVAGVLFLVSCGDNGSVTNSANAGTVTAASDQMLCWSSHTVTRITDENGVDPNTGEDLLTCMKKSTRVQTTYQNLAPIYAEGWFIESVSTPSGFSPLIVFVK